MVYSEPAVATYTVSILYTFGDQSNLVDSCSLSSAFYLTCGDATTTDDGDAGIISIDPTDEALGLDMACEEVTIGGVNQKFLQCTSEYGKSIQNFHSQHMTAHCTGDDSSRDSLSLNVIVPEQSVLCSGNYGQIVNRLVLVNHFCSLAVEESSLDPTNDIYYFPGFVLENLGCAGDNVAFENGGCSGTSGCGFGGYIYPTFCDVPLALPAFRMYAEAEPNCWMPIIDTTDDDDIIFDNVKIAKYAIDFTLSEGEGRSGDSCQVQSPSTAIITCGQEEEEDGAGRISMIEENASDAFFCEPVEGNLHSLQCTIETTTDLPFGFVQIGVECRGTSRSQLSISAQLDPVYMECFVGFVGSSPAGYISLVSYAAGAEQICNDDGIVGDVSEFYGLYQTCSPLSSTSTGRVDASDDDDDEEEDDGDDDDDSFSVKYCRIDIFNCHSVGTCEVDGRKSLGPIRSTIHPKNVRQECLKDEVPLLGGICFSSENTVELHNGDMVSIAGIGLGDRVRTSTSTGNEAVYEPIYSWSHFQPNQEAVFLQLWPSRMELSPNHLVFLQNRKIATPARLVQVGDILHSGQVVTAIRQVKRRGVYAPFTPSGKIVVNDGQLASTFVSLQDGDGLIRFSNGWSTSLLSYHTMARLFESPHRLYYFWFANGKNSESYTEEGISTWVAWPLEFSLWLLHQPSIIQGAVFLPLLLFLGIVSLVEWIFWFMYSFRGFMAFLTTFTGLLLLVRKRITFVSKK